MSVRAQGRGHRAQVLWKGVALFLLAAGLHASAAPLAAGRQDPATPFLGAWNITGVAPDDKNIYWLEVDRNAGHLTGLFLNRVAHPTPPTAIKIDNGELVFQISGTPDKPTGPEFRARIDNGRLVGHHTITVQGARGADGTRGPSTQRIVNWVGVRPPVFPRADANAAHTFGTPVVLFDASMKDAPLADVWDVQYANRPIGWSVDAEGLLANQAPGGNNIISKQKFGDFKVEVEYKLEKESNSGIYLRGRYELQVLDDVGDTTTEPFLTQMAVYGRTPPLVRASKAPGEWQAMDATIVANKVTAHLNGQVVQNNTTIGGVTGGTLDNDELAPGPLMIQGDHGHVWIRKIVVTPIVK